MADVTITTTGVKKADSNGKTESYIAAETITAGQAVYINSNGKAALADANGAQQTGKVKGIALNGGAIDQPIQVLTQGNLTANGFTKGISYFLSGTAGGLCPEADVTAGMYKTLIGIATSTTNLYVDPVASGATV